MSRLPKRIEGLLKRASAPFAPQKSFSCSIFNTKWDKFVEDWAIHSYNFLCGALGEFHKEPSSKIRLLSDAEHIAGANAAFSPDSGDVWLHPYMEGNPGVTLEKITHELLHANLNNFPEGDPFYEEGFVDYSVWVLAHAPIWEPYRKEMIKAASYNIECRRERALKDLSDYDRKRWAGGIYCSTVHGPWIIWRLRMRKAEGDLRW